jgi:hypothetical protein
MNKTGFFGALASLIIGGMGSTPSSAPLTPKRPSAPPEGYERKTSPNPHYKRETNSDRRWMKLGRRAKPMELTPDDADSRQVRRQKERLRAKLLRTA